MILYDTGYHNSYHDAIPTNMRVPAAFAPGSPNPTPARASLVPGKRISYQLAKS